MQDMRVETLRIDQLVPADYNPRKDLKPGDKEYALIKKSLEKHGYQSPIIWNEVTGHVVGGHQRLKILREAGVKEVDCVVVHIEDETDEQEMNLILNKAHGRRDVPKLADILEGLQIASYDMEATGLTAPTIDEILSQAHSKDVQEDEYSPDPDMEVFVQPGDVWVLGKHRLLCGDGTDAYHTEHVLESRKANMCICRPTIGDDVDETVFCVNKVMAEFLAPGGSAYVFHPDEYGAIFRQGFKDVGFHLSGVCIWQKSESSGDGSYHTQHEPVLFGWKPGTHQWLGGRNRTTVWTWPDMKRDSEGLEIMPISIAALPIRNSSAPNGIVLDLFGAHGSVLMACEQTNRLYRGLENSPKYASMIIDRYRRMYPQKPVWVERNGVRTAVNESAQEGR